MSHSSKFIPLKKVTDEIDFIQIARLCSKLSHLRKWGLQDFFGQTGNKFFHSQLLFRGNGTHPSERNGKLLPADFFGCFPDPPNHRIWIERPKPTPEVLGFMMNDLPEYQIVFAHKPPLMAV
jgi:hypothetical protein